MVYGCLVYKHWRKANLGAPSRIRTYDLELRSLLLYPAELSGQNLHTFTILFSLSYEIGRADIYIAHLRSIFSLSYRGNIDISRNG